MFEQVNALTVANCALNWGQKLPNNKYANYCNVFFTCLRNSSNTRERSNLHKLFCVSLLRSRCLCRHATLIAANGALEPNHILFLTFSQSDVCFHDVRKVDGMVTPPITAFLIIYRCPTWDWQNNIRELQIEDTTDLRRGRNQFFPSPVSLFPFPVPYFSIIFSRKSQTDISGHPITGINEEFPGLCSSAG